MKKKIGMTIVIRLIKRFTRKRSAIHVSGFCVRTLAVIRVSDFMNIHRNGKLTAPFGCYMAGVT